MRHRNEVLMKSYGDGVIMLRFQAEQTFESVTRFMAECSLGASEFVFGSSQEVYLLMEEGHPVTIIEVRNTEDEWDDMVKAVTSTGSDSFKSRVSNLASSRKTLSTPASQLA